MKKIIKTSLTYLMSAAFAFALLIQGLGYGSVWLNSVILGYFWISIFFMLFLCACLFWSIHMISIALKDFDFYINKRDKKDISEYFNEPDRVKLMETGEQFAKKKSGAWLSMVITLVITLLGFGAGFYFSSFVYCVGHFIMISATIAVFEQVKKMKALGGASEETSKPIVFN